MPDVSAFVDEVGRVGKRLVDEAQAEEWRLALFWPLWARSAGGELAPAGP